MNKNTFSRWLSPGIWGLGCLAMGIRRGMYAAPVDQTGLMGADQPLKPVLLLTVLAALALTVLGSRRQKGSGAFADHFSGSLTGFVGHTAAAAGILLTVLLNDALLPGRIGLLWKALGYVSPVGLFLAGYARLQGKKAFFLFHAAACAFLTLHLVDHYQLWCSNPQLQDYAFALFGTVALTLFSYQLTAFDVDKGNRQALVFWGLLAQFLCLGELALSRNLYLYAGGFLWAATSLCTLNPAQQAEEGEV